MPYDVARLQSDIAQVQHDCAGFGTGRLVAEDLVLTAAHTLWNRDGTGPFLDDWQVRLARDRQRGTWHFRCGNRVEWYDRALDLSLIRLADPKHGPFVPELRLRVATVLKNNAHPVEARGYPRASKRAEGPRDLTPALGRLTAADRHQPLRFGVDRCDLPNEPHAGWSGMSGSAVMLQDCADHETIWIYGVVREVPANFDGQLRVARLADAWQDAQFRSLLVGAGAPDEDAEDPTDAAPLPPAQALLGATRVLVPSEQAPRDYIDRPELTDPLLAHLLGNEGLKGRAMISAVHGLGGIGKTTVARWLAWQPEVEQRFPDGRIWVTLGREPLDALTIINDCVNQLDPALKTRATKEAARADLATLLQERSNLFIIDDVWPESVEVAKALLVPSPRSRFLLTTRFPQLADDPEIRAKVFPLDSMSVDQAVALIIQALGRKLSAVEQPLAERLCEILGGHPLALELAAARVKEGRRWETLLDDLAAEIRRLEVLEETDDLVAEPVIDEARRRRKGVRASLLLSVRYLNTAGQKLFAWLGIVAEDAIISPLMAATLWSTKEETAGAYLRTLGSLGLLSKSNDVYRIHDLMRDLARELLTTPETEDIPGLGLTLQSATKQLLERYQAKTSNGLWHTLPEDGYIHDHLARHFEQAGWRRELEKLLWEESTDGHCGWYQARERLGEMGGFIADVHRVWDLADRALASGADVRSSGQAVALQLHCALIIASINSLSSGISSPVLVGAVRSKLIPLSAALALARQNPSAYDRVRAFLALMEVPGANRSSILAEAFAEARAIDDDEERNRSLAQVAPWLPTGEALVVARGIDDAGWRAPALAEVAQRLPVEEQRNVRGEALSAARSLENHARRRARALVEVAQRLPAEEQGSVFAEALSAAHGTDDVAGRARALAEIAPWLPAEEQRSVLAEALSTARCIRDNWRDQALAEVGQQLPPAEALVVARDINNAASRARALAEVAQRLPADQERSVLAEALGFARSIDRARGRAWALAEVARRLPAEEQRSVFAEALSLVRAINDEGWGTGALVEIARRLPPEDALGVARDIDDARLRVQSLAEVAQRLPAEEQGSVFAEALGTARAIGYAGGRASALAAIEQRLPADQQRSVLGEALRAARDINGAGWRARMLAELAQRLPAEEQRNVRAEALSAARAVDNDAFGRDQSLAALAQLLPACEALEVAPGIDNPGVRLRMLTEVAQRELPAEEQRIVRREALNAVRAVNASARPGALAEIAPWLPVEEQPSVINEALSAARAIDEVWARARALTKIAPWLPAEEQRSVLAEALSAARAIAWAGSRAQALADVGQQLPPAEALVVARDINDAGWRARVLAEVAQRLPAEEQGSVFAEALGTARALGDARGRARALQAVAQWLPAEQQPGVLGEALRAARDLDDGRGGRARALAGLVPQLTSGQSSDFAANQWVYTLRVLAMSKRSDCTKILEGVIPRIDSFGGAAALRGLARSIRSVGTWWP